MQNPPTLPAALTRNARIRIRTHVTYGHASGNIRFSEVFVYRHAGRPPGRPAHLFHIQMDTRFRRNEHIYCGNLHLRPESDSGRIENETHKRTARHFH